MFFSTFYGLERRFFIDSPGPHERRIIIDEVDRLLQIYGDHRSVRRYFESFLDAARASLASDEEVKPRFWTAGYELPLGLRVALGRRAWRRPAPERRLGAELVLGPSGLRPQDSSISRIP